MPGRTQPSGNIGTMSFLCATVLLAFAGQREGRAGLETPRGIEQRSPFEAICRRNTDELDRCPGVGRQRGVEERVWGGGRINGKGKRGVAASQS